jgi:hypothetical protein
VTTPGSPLANAPMSLVDDPNTPAQSFCDGFPFGAALATPAETANGAPLAERGRHEFLHHLEPATFPI